MTYRYLNLDTKKQLCGSLDPEQYRYYKSWIRMARYESRYRTYTGTYSTVNVQYKINSLIWIFSL